jgi:Type I restriction enzyme R protein N terminus (HSDR_N)
MLNEEEVKNKIILPCLNALGLQQDKMTFEKTFTIRLGRNRHQIGKQQENKAYGRLDILVTHNKKNLFVIETKEESHDIDDDDIEQAISYSRLLDDMAPFAIVSNGVQTRIYDVYSGSDLTDTDIKESEYVKSGYKISFSPELRNIALKKLIDIDYHNLLNFCKYQIEWRMSNLIGEDNSSIKKYIRQVFVERDGLYGQFLDFISDDSHKNCFVIDGECNLLVNRKDAK